jgi:MSHA biogenesis protein MshJ
MNTAALRQKLDTVWVALPTLGRRFDARPLRERLMITLAVLAVGVMLLDRFWLDGVFKRFRAHQTEISAWKDQRRTIDTEISNLTQELRSLEQTKAQQVEEVRKRLADAQAALNDNQQGVVSAQQMLPLLQQLLQRSPCASGEAGCSRIRVRSVKSLGRSEVTLRAVQQAQAAALPGAVSAASGLPNGASAMPQTAAPAVAAGPGLWRHGIEVTLEGSYADLSAYVQHLEALPQRVLRAGMRFQVEAHPKASLTLTLYTLSLDHSWLEI